MDSGPSAGAANPVERLFDYVLHERRQALFPPGVRVLDVGQGEPEGAWGAAFAGPETADRLGPAEVGRLLRSRLPAGAPVLLAFPGARPRELRRALGPGLEWRGSFALGVLLPGRAHGAWAAAHPKAFGLLAAAEELVRRWPFLRAWGEVTGLEGVRR